MWLGEDYYTQEAASLEKLREVVNQLALKPQQDISSLLTAQERFCLSTEIIDNTNDITLPPTVRQQLEKIGCIIGVPPLSPLLKELTESGLLQQQGEREETEYSFHELVKEQCVMWVEAHYDDFQKSWEM